MKNIITISRQFGSGGRTIGKMVAQNLGIPCYDKELIEKIAKESGYAADYVAEGSEYSPTIGSFAYGFLGRDPDGLSNADYIWFAQKKVITELSSKGSCVFVGRCADYLLKDRDDCLNVFIYADKEFRAKRIVKKYGENSISPMKRLDDKDKRRKLNYRYFTEQEWGKRENYHLSIDSGYLGIHTAIEIIINAAKGEGNHE